MPYHAKPIRTLPRHAKPCPERFALLLPSPALPYLARPHAKPGLDFHALLRQTMPYLGLFDFFDFRLQ